MKAMNARIVISCLALAAMLIMAAPAANAQGVAFQASSLPLQARGEGLTETIGAVVLQATATGTVPAGSSITIVYSGTIANASSFTGTAGLSCSIAPQGSITALVPCGAGVFTTSATGSQLTVQFNSAVTFTAGNYIEVSQVRMNVNALGSGATTVTATLSGTSSLPASNPITFTQSTVGVSSIVNPSVKGSIPTGGAATAIQTCSVLAQGAAGTTFTVKVAENYPAALTSTADEASFSSLGTIANGSLINVAVSNVPSGLAVSALTYVATQGSTTGASVAFGTASTGTVTLSQTGTNFQVSSGSTTNYTFAVTGDSTSAIETYTITFGIGLPKSSNTAFATSAGTLTPIGTVVSATATVSLAPSNGVVSFATNNEGGGTIAQIGDCVTNLLFPFTTNQVGFDSNIQISNTSADKLAFPSGGASAQAGTCTLTYYPTDLTTQTSSAAGTAGTPSQFTTPSIPAGGAFSFAQSTSTFKNQSGYLFAVCRFLDAHGFSFVVNGTPTTGTISQGLLALVIPNTSIATGRLANYSGATGGNPTSPGSYEALSH